MKHYVDLKMTKKRLNRYGRHIGTFKCILIQQKVLDSTWTHTCILVCGLILFILCFPCLVYKH